MIRVTECGGFFDYTKIAMSNMVNRLVRNNDFVLQVSAALLMGVVLFILQQGAASPFHPALPKEGAARLQVSFSWMTRPVEPCRKLSPQELAGYRPDIAKSLAITGICSPERRPAVLQVWVDGQQVTAREYNPRGLRRNGHVTGVMAWPVAAGRHRVTVRLAEAGGDVISEYTEERAFQPGNVWMLDLAYPNARWRGWP